VAVRIISPHGFLKAQVDGKSIEASEENLIQSPDYGGALDRYDLELADGADRFVLAAEPS
jgi:hypothetical protein